jgi:hypothetical protein
LNPSRALASFTLAILCAIIPNLADAQPPPAIAAGAARTNRVSITIEGEFRVIRANGLPDHATGQFPNAHNPNSIAPQNYVFRVPLHPVPAAQSSRFVLQPFGIAINGILFDPGANEWWNRDRNSGWQYEPMTGHLDLGVDQYNAHVQPSGAYHYHGLPVGLLANIQGAQERMVLIGWAADGYPIYAPWAYSNAKDATSPLKPMKSSYRLKPGARPGGPGGNYDGTFVADFEYAAGTGTLDECNGRWGVTPEFPEGTYTYFITQDFPFIPRMFKGTPDTSFQHRGPPPGGGPGDRRPGGPGRPPPGLLDDPPPPPGGGRGF